MIIEQVTVDIFFRKCKQKTTMLWSIDKTFSISHLKSDLRTRKIAGQGDDYTTGCLLDYPYVKDHYDMIATDSSKQQALDADPKAIQQVNFTGLLEIEMQVQQYFPLLKKQKKPFYFRFFTGNLESVINMFCFIKY